jgi:hypothetical protein
MRRFVPVLITLFLAVGFTEIGQTRGRAQPRDATTVLAAAREALGGDARLGAVKTFIASGRTRQVRGENLVPIEFEIQAELPE